MLLIGQRPYYTGQHPNKLNIFCINGNWPERNNSENSVYSVRLEHSMDLAQVGTAADNIARLPEFLAPKRCAGVRIHRLFEWESSLMLP